MTIIFELAGSCDLNVKLKSSLHEQLTDPSAFADSQSVASLYFCTHRHKMAFLDVPSSSSISFSNIISEGEEEREFRTLLESAAAISDKGSKPVKPHRGFCVKFRCRAEGNKKAFINICHTDEIPEPLDVSEEELTRILESEDSASYRIPLSLGVPHEEQDKKGETCMAYDVIINSTFFRKCSTKPLFKEFMILLAAQGVEDKYSTELSREGYVILQNRKFIGTMPEHYIRERGTEAPRPRIDEVEAPPESAKAPIKNRIATPKQYSNVKMNRVQKPGRTSEHLVAEISVPELKSIKDITLDIAKDRILIRRLPSPSKEIDLYLPLEINVDSVKAQFDYKTLQLRVDAPIVAVL